MGVKEKKQTDEVLDESSSPQGMISKRKMQTTI